MTAITAWEEAYQRFETPAEERRKFIRRLRRLGVSRWNRDWRILEICSGRGNGLLAWQQLGFPHVVGVDLSLALLERSESRGRSLVGDARCLPVRTSSQNVAIVQGGLHHVGSLDDVRAALREMHRVLRPDGLAIIIEPWNTPFLRGVHLVAERKIIRALSPKLDAFAAMTEEERTTYEAWLAHPDAILSAITSDFEAIVTHRRLGKLVFLGRPGQRPRPPTASLSSARTTGQPWRR